MVHRVFGNGTYSHCCPEWQVISAPWMSQSIRAIIDPRNLHYRYFSGGDVFLQPELLNLEMPHFANSLAEYHTPGRGRVRPQLKR